MNRLRKNTGQNLAGAGVPLNVVQYNLEHSQSETTIKFYNQVDPRHLDKVRCEVDKRLCEVEKKYVSVTYEPDFVGSQRKQ